MWREMRVKIASDMVGEASPLASFGILSGPRSLSLPKGRYPFERGAQSPRPATPRACVLYCKNVY